jgi:hypothetical protein
MATVRHERYEAFIHTANFSDEGVREAENQLSEN